MRMILTLALFCCGSILMAQSTVPSNSPPTIVVTSSSGPISNAGTVNVAYNTTVQSLAIQITTDDPDGGKVATGTTVSNIGATGILVAEWGSTGNVPYTDSPVTGTFNTVAGVTHRVTVVATDGASATASFTFDIVQAPQGGGPTNNAPTVALTDGGNPVTNGATINVAYNDTLAARNFIVTVNDADSDNTSCATTITNIGSTGMLTSEWTSGSAPVSYTLSPTSGVFNTVAAVTYTVTITADDGTDQTVFSFYISQTAQGGGGGGTGGGATFGGGGGGGGCIAASSHAPLWALLLMLGATTLAYRRRKSA
ncbi:MAG: hypothetical protein ACYTDT_08430 [Planctomycetota bacterium]